MTSDQGRRIKPTKHVDAEIHLPPSKSYTNRALIVAALADGTSTLVNPSRSDDSNVLITALEEFGVQTTFTNQYLEVCGTGGNLQVPSKEIHVGNAGTTMRFLTTLASLVPGETILTGDEKMLHRPIGDLLEALKIAGIKSTSDNGYPQVKIYGGHFIGGQLEINASVSSQFVSSILLTAPFAKRPVTLRVKGKLSSLPYVDMSLHVMRAFSTKIEVSDLSMYAINNTERYIGREFEIEPDASSATYFLAAAAITGGRIVIANLPSDSLQGDIRFFDVLSDMGCTITRNQNGIELHGGKLHGIDVDMNEMPDCVPTLAIVAAFAEGPTTIYNIAHLKHKESNRLETIAAELIKLGANVTIHDDGLTIMPRPLHGATIETYNDHRIAMSFAVAGLRIPGVIIKNPMCVTKSFPNFWEVFTQLEAKE
jgi:3-phosphoshikimate 1-carboxyvinyltransferase